jgi:hypothetical protein
MDLALVGIFELLFPRAGSGSERIGNEHAELVLSVMLQKMFCIGQSFDLYPLVTPYLSATLYPFANLHKKVFYNSSSHSFCSFRKYFQEVCRQSSIAFCVRRS